MSNLVDLKNINKSFDTFKKIKVLNKISYKFKKGKIYSLMGPSGSGKSTLLNLISFCYLKLIITKLSFLLAQVIPSKS